MLGHLDSIAATGSVAGTGAPFGHGQRQAASRATVRLWDHDPLAAGDGYSSSGDEDSPTPSRTPPGATHKRHQTGSWGGSSTGTSTPQRPPTSMEQTSHRQATSVTISAQCRKAYMRHLLSQHKCEERSAEEVTQSLRSAGTPAQQKLSWEQLDRQGVSTVLREYYKVRSRRYMQWHGGAICRRHGSAIVSPLMLRSLLCMVRAWHTVCLRGDSKQGGAACVMRRG